MRPVVSSSGLTLNASKVAEPLNGYDLVIVPGGLGSRALIEDSDFIRWLTTAEACPIKASVCTGSLLLGAAGFLKGKRATTHPNAFSDLRKYCAQVVDSRIVDEGDVITARGVTSSIDLGLYLCARLASSQAEQSIRKQMDYPYAWKSA
jgi:transcriptional regulator GlxA family with amidase domain